MWLKQKLESNPNIGKEHNNVRFIEKDLGHMGLLMPNNRALFQEIFDLIKEFNHEGDQTFVNAKKKHVATANYINCTNACLLF